MYKLSYLGQFAAQIIETWQANSSTGNTPTATKTFVVMATHSFPHPHPLDFNMLVIFTSKNVTQGHKLKKNILICLLDHVYQAPFANMKIECQGGPEMSLILGRSGTQYVAMAIKLLSSNSGAHLVESSCKESNISDTNWLRYLFSSYLIKTWLSI